MMANFHCIISIIYKSKFHWSHAEILQEFSRFNISVVIFLRVKYKPYVKKKFIPFTSLERIEKKKL